MWQFLPANEKIQVSYNLLITHCAKIPSLGKSKQRVVSKPQDPKDKMRSNIIKGHFRAPIEVHPLLSLNSRYISIGNHSQCAQSQPSFLSTRWTYYLKFALTTIISKSFFMRLKQSEVFTLDFVLVLRCFVASIETFLKDLFYRIYMLQGLFVWESTVLCFGRLLQERRQCRVSGRFCYRHCGLPEQLLGFELWSSWWSRVFLITLLLKSTTFWNFFFLFFFSSLSCFMSPLHCILLFYILSVISIYVQ